MACRLVKSRADLIRFVALEGQVRADLAGRAPGRGAYLCRDTSCWTQGERRRALDRALRVKLTAEDWRRLREGILS